jgi:hypothetical protein
MGGTGVLPFCSEQRKLQLIVSRVPDELVASADHEWAYTLFCFFPSKQNPSWKYLVGTDGQVLTAGSAALKLLPKRDAKSGEVCLPRERPVTSGTLIKMYDFQAPKSNICGELFKKMEEFLLRPALPMRIIECRPEYAAKVMRVTVWDRIGRIGKDKLETGFEDGASIQIKLSTNETIPTDVRVFKKEKGDNNDLDQPLTGLRAVINGQSHAKRDAHFFRNRAVDKEHIAASILVTLDCSELGQQSRNDLFMANREQFRETPLLNELFKKLQKELRDHEGLKDLNLERYEQKIADAVVDEEGISALEELLSTDPSLADLFGTFVAGKVAAKTATDGTGGKIKGDPQPFVGNEFPNYFRRSDGSTLVEVDLPRGDATRVSFQTDVKNNYFSRRRHRGICEFKNGFQPTFHLFNGRMTFTCQVDKKAMEGSAITCEARITDNAGSGPFKITIVGHVVAPREKATRQTQNKPKPEPMVNTGPSRPNVEEVDNGPDAPPLTIERHPKTDRLQILVNKGSQFLIDAKRMRTSEEEAAVVFVFKYGLALAAMGLLDKTKKTEEWKTKEAECRTRIQDSVAGIARVIVPLCLSLPKKLPKPAYV